MQRAPVLTNANNSSLSTSENVWKLKGQLHTQYSLQTFNKLIIQTIPWTTELINGARRGEWERVATIGLWCYGDFSGEFVGHALTRGGDQMTRALSHEWATSGQPFPGTSDRRRHLLGRWMSLLPAVHTNRVVSKAPWSLRTIQGYGSECVDEAFKNQSVSRFVHWLLH